MIRTQIQLTRQQQEMLRDLSAQTGKSMAELIRESIDRGAASKPRISRQERIEKAVRLAGQFSSGSGDGSTRHDRHLVAAFK